jgi:hypothetical protein
MEDVNIDHVYEVMKPPKYCTYVSHKKVDEFEWTGVMFVNYEN